MDELGLARAAVAAELITDRQLAECREIAAGGRSLLAILLEMGYLRAADLGRITGAAPPPARKVPRRAVWFVLGAVPSILFAVLLVSARPAYVTSPALMRENAKLRARTVELHYENMRLNAHGTAPRETAETVALVQAILAAVVDPADAPAQATAPLQRARDELAIATQTPVTIIARGQAEELLGNVGAARAMYLSAIQRGGQPVDAHVGLSRLGLRAGDPSFALQHLGEASRMQPRHALVHYWKGRAHLAQDLPEAARRHFDEALALDPSLKREIRKYVKVE